jgi:hypothetical protein
MKHIALLLLLALLGLQATAQMHGNYAVTHGKKPDSGYQLLKIHAKESGSLLFYLEVGLGAPDYTSGSLYGKLTQNARTGNYEYKGGCRLIFTKSKTAISIKTISGNCGLGYGVHADGRYSLIDHNNPKDFVDRSGHKIYFDKTSPGKYSE